MIVLDANVLIALFDGQDAQQTASQVLFHAIEGEDIGANTLTIAEILVRPARDGKLAAAASALDDPEVQELALSAIAGPALARLRAETGLKLPDCCVLLSAMDAGAKVASFDIRLRSAALNQGLEVLPATLR